MAVYSYDGAEHGESGPFVSVPLDTPFDKVVFWGSITMGTLALPLIAGETYGLALTCAIVAIVLGAMVWKGERVYYFDRASKRIDYARRFFGLGKRKVLCSFDDIIAVSAGGKRCADLHEVWWEYRVYLVSNTGVAVPISNPYREDLGMANNRARGLAGSLSVSFVEGRSLNEIRPSRDPSTGRVSVHHEAFDRFRQVILPPIIVVSIVSLATILEAFFFIY